VAIVSLGRAGALGEKRRVQVWCALAHECGADVDLVELSGDARGLPGRSQLAATLAGRGVPEQLTWSLARLRTRLAASAPHVVVCVTTRAFHPVLLDDFTVVLDLVDSLADSYAQRATVHASPVKRVAYRALAIAHRRAEQRARSLPVSRVVAGFGDAARFDATWVPNVAAGEPAPAAGRTPTHDLVFFGSLGYPPNVAALQVLDRWWPALVAARPATSLLVAGASPSPVVRDLALRRGWTLEDGYDEPVELCRRARVAVAPLPHAAGFQNKVLEAALAGVAQVVSPAVTRGLDPDFPLVVAASGDELVAAVVDLLDDEERRTSLGRAATAHVRAHYRTARHADALRRLLPADSLEPGRTPPMEDRLVVPDAASVR
jgi:glycosyltransferase involved in cell wall biosynthesis